MYTPMMHAKFLQLSPHTGYPLFAGICGNLREIKEFTNAYHIAAAQTIWKTHYIKYSISIVEYDTPWQGYALSI